MNYSAAEMAALQKMTARELRARYAEVFGEATPGNNRSWLIRRIAWRLQARTEGDLGERARRRAEELADDADLRVSPPRGEKVEPVAVAVPNRDPRLPPPGSILSRSYKGVMAQIKVLESGFEYDGVRHRTLSAVAKAITGSHTNGFLFFHLIGEGEGS